MRTVVSGNSVASGFLVPRFAREHSAARGKSATGCESTELILSETQRESRTCFFFSVSLGSKRVLCVLSGRPAFHHGLVALFVESLCQPGENAFHRRGLREKEVRHETEDWVVYFAAFGDRQPRA